MSDSQRILKMIEEVSPDDAARLDEIDARVWCYLRRYTFGCVEYYLPSTKAGKRRFSYDDNGTYGLSFSQTKYTRSRNDLKVIRPKGWWLSINNGYENDDPFAHIQSFFHTYKENYGSGISHDCPVNFSVNCKTEELAELHVIIQAIEYERGHNA